jgi:hypothetical protein
MEAAAQDEPEIEAATAITKRPEDYSYVVASSSLRR